MLKSQQAWIYIIVFTAILVRLLVPVSAFEIIVPASAQQHLNNIDKADREAFLEAMNTVQDLLKTMNNLPPYYVKDFYKYGYHYRLIVRTTVSKCMNNCQMIVKVYLLRQANSSYKLIEKVTYNMQLELLPNFIDMLYSTHGDTNKIMDLLKNFVVVRYTIDAKGKILSLKLGVNGNLCDFESSGKIYDKLKFEYHYNIHNPMCRGEYITSLAELGAALASEYIPELAVTSVSEVLESLEAIIIPSELLIL